MLEKSDTGVADVLARFNRYNLEVALLVPTETGMAKSIMDATAPVRDYFEETGFHDYDTQAQGPEAKVTKGACFVHTDRLENTTVSLYRPNTKFGDPRVWFGKLKRYANPWNLLAVLVHDSVAHVVNCSDPVVLSSLDDVNTPLGKIAAKSKPGSPPAVPELLSMIRQVWAKGFVRTLRAGDTGVGMTLESLLGIPANPHQTPDYKGIELKAKRLKKGSGNRVTLFSQVPNWNLSPIGSAWNLLSTYGYVKDGKLRLNHEINAKGPNSLGFYLQVDSALDWLKQNHRDLQTSVTSHVTTWELEKLRQRLRDKHRQTFWVGAQCRGSGKNEEFHYVQVEHTKQPIVRNFDTLIEGGVISVDYLMSEKGMGRVRDHGYLFKLHASDFRALFPPSEIHEFE